LTAAHVNCRSSWSCCGT